MRERIFRVIEASDGNDMLSSIYDYSMMFFIVLSLTPLLFKDYVFVIDIIDKVTVSIFIIDYFLRLFTADYKFGKKKLSSFVRYPFSLMAIVDIITILPSFTPLNSGFKLFRIFRLIRATRALRGFRNLPYLKSLVLIGKVLNTSRESLIDVCALALAYILLSALIIFNVEPDTFNNFFEAIYWATVSLTTVGYGDIYPVTTIGRIVTMISSIFGIAIVALPAGIITAGYMKALEKNDRQDKDVTSAENSSSDQPAEITENKKS